MLNFSLCALLVSLAAFGFALLSRRATVEPAKLVLADLPRFARAAPLLLGLVVIFGFVDANALAIAPLYLVDGGASSGAAASFIAVMHAGMIVAQPCLGILLDRLERWSVAIGCLAANGVGFGAIVLIPVTHWAIWPLGAVAGAAFFGIYTSALSILGRDHEGGMLVAGASAFSVAYALGGVVGPALSGLASDRVPGTALVPIVIVALGGAVLIGASRRRQG